MKNTNTQHIKVGSVTVAVTRRLTPSGNPAFLLSYYAGSKRKQEACGTNEAIALNRAKKLAEALSTHGARVAQTSPAQMDDYVRASDALEPFGVALGSAVDHLAGWLNKFRTLEGIDRALVAGPVAVNETRTIAAAIDEMIALKVSHGISEVYRRDMRTRLVGQFALAFKCNVDTVTTPAIQNWLDAKKLNPTTFNNMRRLIGTLFEHCVKRGYCAVNPVTRIDPRKARATESEIYTPEQMQKLLAASDNGFQLMLAICGFAGLRTAEFERLTWGHVDFESGYIKLTPDITKTNKRRLVPISANLRAWLEQVPKEKQIGKVWRTKRIIFERRDCSLKAGVPWLGNALRHSFCSYRLMITGETSTAREAGNSPAMIDQHYKELVTEAAARDWFAIVPPAPAPAS
jgi:integrase